MEEERQEEPEQPEVREGKGIRHAALAQERQTVPVTADLRIRNWHGFAEAQGSLVNAGLIEAVSAQVVPPFEQPIGIPTYVGQQEGREIESQQTAVVQEGSFVGPGAPPGGVSAPDKAPARVVPANPSTSHLRDPRVVEDRLAFALASAVAPGPAQQRPAQEKRGAHTTLESIGHTGDVQAWQQYLLNKAIEDYFAGQLGLAETFILESFLTATVVYGTFKSVQAIQEWLTQRNTPFPEKGTIRPPRPLLYGSPSGAKPLVPRRPAGAGAVAAGTGDIPGQGSFLREFRAGLRQGEQP